MLKIFINIFIFILSIILKFSLIMRFLMERLCYEWFNVITHSLSNLSIHIIYQFDHSWRKSIKSLLSCVKWKILNFIKLNKLSINFQNLSFEFISNINKNLVYWRIGIKIRYHLVGLHRLELDNLITLTLIQLMDSQERFVFRFISIRKSTFFTWNVCWNVLAPIAELCK